MNFKNVLLPSSKFILCLLCICLPSLHILGQTGGKPATAVSAYDSLNEIITAENYRKYIGQGVYFSAKSKKYREYAHNQKYYEQFYKGLDPYDAIAGKNFVIVDIINHLDRNKYDDSHRGLYFTLKNPITNDTFSYQVALERNYVYPDPHPMFYFSGYLEKLKQVNVNKTFIANTDLMGLKDMNTGQPVMCNTGSIWICTGLTMIETTDAFAAKAVYVFKDSLSHQIVVGTGETKSEGIDATYDNFDMKKTGVARRKSSKQKAKN